MRVVKGELVWRCSECRAEMTLHQGYLSRLVMGRRFLERMVDAEQHRCGEAK